MSKTLDDLLTEHFQPERIKAAFKAYKEAKTDVLQSIIKVPMGADGISFEVFEKELDLRCKFLSKRLLEGKYSFYPFRQVSIPKPSGGERILSIATIRDVIVQKVLYDALYEEVEKDFKVNILDKVSFAYRKGKSAPYAASLIHRYIKQGFVFALDADIVKFFDRIPHQRLIDVIQNKFGQDTKATKFLRRFIKTGGFSYNNGYIQAGSSLKKIKVRVKGKKLPYLIFFRHYKPNRKIIFREQGIPQGGVLSGMLANLYLHEFDCWILNDLSKIYPLKYVRYADDFVVLLKRQEDIAKVHALVADKLKKIELELHKDTSKTKHVDIAKDSLEFIGFQFTLTNIRVKEANIHKFKERILNKITKELSYKSGEKPERRFKFFIQHIINRKVLGRGETTCSKCNGVIGERVKSWIGFFMVITDTPQLRMLDKWIRGEVSKHFYENYQLRLKKSSFKNAGLITLEKEYYRLHKRKSCSCDKSNYSLTLTSGREVAMQTKSKPYSLLTMELFIIVFLFFAFLISLLAF